MAKKLDLTGMRFGKWTVSGLSLRTNRNMNTYWEVVCDCGKESAVLGTCLNTGKSTSCVICSPRVKRTKDGDSAKWSLFTQNKAFSVRRGKTWTLSLEEFLRITGAPCHYCGIQYSSEHPKTFYTANTKRQNLVGKLKMNGTYKHNGIDRVDSGIGYVSDNCVPCCRHCNMAKAEMTQDVFREWIKRVHGHFVEKAGKVFKGDLTTV